MRNASREIEPFLSGELVHLDALNPDNFDIYAEWSNNPQLRMISHDLRIFPVTLEEQRILLEPSKDYLSNSFRFEVTEKKTKKIIGLAGLEKINYIDRHAELNILLIPSFDSRNFYLDVLSLLIEYGFREFNMYRLSILIPEIKKDWNSHVKHFGMIYEMTRQEDRYINGCYKDVDEFSILKDEWEGIHLKKSKRGV